MQGSFFLFPQLILLVYAQYGMDRPMSNIDNSQMPQVLPPCPGLWQWGCKNGECIAQYDVCDGIAQCSDGSDEWNCNDLSRLRQNPGKAAEIASGNAAVAPTITTTTAAPTSSEYLVMNRRQVILTVTVFAMMAVLIVLFIRRRARQKSALRNRRVGMLHEDSDEDDVLISSMYS